MNAFDMAIERIDEINVPDELKPTVIRAFQYFSKFFDAHPDIRIDFNDLFKRKLYASEEEKGLGFCLVECFEHNYAGTYDTIDNIINVLKKEEYREIDVHVFMHEFIHFIIHNTYENYLPSWADEMMTEFSTGEIHNGYYGHYMTLLNVAYAIDQYFEQLSIEQFFNGEFNEFIKKNNLRDYDGEFNLLKKSEDDDFKMRTKIIRHFLQKEYYEARNKNSLADVLNHLIGKTSNYFLNRQDIINDLCFYALDYIGKQLNVNCRDHYKLAYDYVTQFYVHRFIENECHTEIVGMEKIVFGGANHYIAYGKDGKSGILLNFCEKTEKYLELNANFANQFTWTTNNSGSFVANYEKPKGSIIFKFEEDGLKEEILLDYNKASKRFIVPDGCEHNYYDCRDNALLRNLVNEIEIAIYENKCRSFDSYQLKRVSSSEAGILSRLAEINQIADFYESGIWCTPSSRFITGYEDGAVIMIPFYDIKEFQENDLSNIDSLSIDGINECLKDEEFGSQISFVVKNKEGALIPIANAVKEYEDNNFALHINYNAFIKDLPTNQKQEIYKNHIQQYKYIDEKI